MPPSPPPQPVVTNGAIIAGGSPAVTSSASLAAQAALAASFYAAQAWLATAATRDVLQIWQALNLRDVRQSWPALRTALAALIRDRHGQAATLGTGYYQQARRAAGVLGDTPRVAVPPLPELQITATLDSTGPWNLLGKIKQGQQVATANENTSVQLAGAAQRLIINGARYGVLQSVKEDAKAVAWMRVTGPNPCAFCAMLASRGAVYRSEETGGFEAHSHCVPAGTLVQGPATEAAYRRWYEGELIVAGTSAGHKLSVTPNHPVLTSQGWVPAGLLREGDEILTSLGAQWCEPNSPDEQQRPALIEDVWGSLGVRGLVGMPVAAEDFHGDGTGGEVDVVFADRLLSDDLHAVLAQPFAEHLLVPTGAVAPAGGLLGLCHAHETLLGKGATTYGSMSRSGEGASLLGSHLGMAQQLSLAGAAELDSFGGKMTPDYVAVYAESLRQSEYRLTAPVGLGESRGGQGHAVPGRPASPPRYDPPTLQDEAEGLRVHADLGRSLAERLAGRVEISRVSDLRRVHFAGHVYNLQTAEGWYEAAGIIVSNCQCVAMPVFDFRVASASHDNPLYDQWRQATKGKSGADAMKAWRTHWDGQQNRDGVRVLPAA